MGLAVDSRVVNVYQKNCLLWPVLMGTGITLPIGSWMKDLKRIVRSIDYQAHKVRFLEKVPPDILDDVLYMIHQLTAEAT